MQRKNIHIIGAQCTGKTTLVNALEKYYQELPKVDISLSGGPSIIREVARTVLKKHQFTAADIRESRERALELQRLILLAQAEAESTVLNEGNWFISDRSCLDPIVYAKIYVGNEAADDLMGTEQWKTLATSLLNSTVAVCEPGAPWLFNDGVRLMPTDNDEWSRTHSTFCALLEHLGIKYVVVPKNLTNLDERVKLVVGSRC